MKRFLGRFAAGAATLATAGVAFGAPSGVWPTYAHDFLRSGRADGTAKMQSPSVAWTKRLGGTLGLSQSIVIDVDGDGRADVVTITGGRVVATNPDGTTLWQGALNGAQNILGVWPLHGSTPEVVLSTTGGVQVLSGTDGHLLTTIVMGAPATATFVPEGGDASTGGLLVLATSRSSVSAFDFRSATNVTTPLWTISGSTQTNYMAGDIDGDGIVDLVHPLDGGFEVDDPLTGTVKYTLPSMGPTAYFYLYELANVDGVPGDEIIAFDTSYLYSPQTGVYVAGVRSGALTTLWSDAVAAVNARDADTYSVAGSAVDLDGDGKVELAYSRWDNTSQMWTTKVVDAATGAVLASLSGQFLQAIADVDGDGKADLVVRDGVTATQSPPRSTLSAYDFANRDAGAVAKSWTLPLARVLQLTSSQRQGPWAMLNVPVVADFDGTTPGIELLVAQDGTSHGDDTQYGILHGSSGTLSHSVPVTATVDPSALGWGNGLTSATSINDVVVFTADGVAHVESSSLSQSSTFGAGTFSNWPYVNGRDTGGNLVFASTSNNHLLWLDATHLHSDNSPYDIFDEPSILQNSGLSAAGYPLDPIVLVKGTQLTYVSFETTQTATATTVSLVEHDTTGIEIWRTPLSAGTQVVSPGAYTQDLTGDGIPDIVLSVQSAATVASLAVYNGATGQLVRSTPVASILSGSDQLATGSLIDVNGDSVPDLVAPEHTHGVLAIDLTQNPMSQIWLIPRGTSGTVNGTVGAGQLDAVDAGGNTLFRVNGNNGFGPYEHYALDGGVLQSVSQGFATGNAFDENTIALVKRDSAGAMDLVSVGTGDVGLSRVRRISGTDLSSVWTKYAANGTISATAPSAGYSLHGPVEVDVNGDGVDDVVFGSDDGYVYAVKSTDGSLVFSVNLNAPVEYLVAANVDLDPALELVVSLADGRLVALDDSYDAPMDPSDGGVDAAPMDGSAEAEAGADASDATVADSGVDGSEDAQGDAVLEASEASVGASGSPGGGGCGCETAIGAGRHGLLALASTVLGLLALGWSRRRRS